MANWSKEKKFIIEFTELYHDLECVRNVKSKDYSNRVRKKLAYDVMVTEVKTADKMMHIMTQL
jgi:hypothetical protein